MENNDIIFGEAGILAEMIRSGSITSFELVSKFIEQTERYNKKINAVVLLNREQALEDAKKADADLQNGKVYGRLHGVPVTFKDNYKIKGMITTAGFRPMKKFVAKSDAAAVNLIKKEGAIILGKTNLSPLAMDVQADNTIFGRTNNPWNLTRTAGGSSGGCAAALASGMTPLSFGNDLAGSIRIPAAFCGIYGFMPTGGTVSLKGTVANPFEKFHGVRGIASAGPLARSIDDIIMAMDIISRPSDHAKRLVPLSRDFDKPDITKLKIGWTDSFGDVPVDDEIKTKIREFVDDIASKGVKTEKVVPKIDFELIWRTWGRIVGMQGGYNIPNILKFLGMFPSKMLVDNTPMLRDIVKPASLTAYFKAVTTQDNFINQFESFMKNYDAWICPVSSTTAFPHHEPTLKIFTFKIYKKPLKVNDEDVNYYMATQAYCIPFNLTESPILSMPAGLSSEGLPIGVQLVGRRFHDFRLLQIGKAISKNIPSWNDQMLKK